MPRLGRDEAIGSNMLSPQRCGQFDRGLIGRLPGQPERPPMDAERVARAEGAEDRDRLFGIDMVAAEYVARII